MQADAEKIKLISGNTALDIFVPDCNEKGEFKPLQCQKSVHLCWCVNSEGTEINGTKSLLTDGGAIPSCSGLFTLKNFF